MVFMTRFMPSRSVQKSMAHTLLYDTTVMGDTQSGHPFPAGRWTGITIPTLVIAGGNSPGCMKNSQRALTGVLPTAQHRVLEGQMHIVKAAALAPVLGEFFAAWALGDAICPGTAPRRQHLPCACISQAAAPTAVQPVHACHRPAPRLPAELCTDSPRIPSLETMRTNPKQRQRRPTRCCLCYC
jgi:hypothetical protein